MTPKFFHLQVPTIALAMGPKGLLSRVLAPKFGAFLTFGTIAAGLESAPGQPTITDLVQTYHLDQQSRETKVGRRPGVCTGRWLCYVRIVQ